jgi:hypothetical protein
MVICEYDDASKAGIFFWERWVLNRLAFFLALSGRIEETSQKRRRKSDYRS